LSSTNVTLYDVTNTILKTKQIYCPLLKTRFNLLVHFIYRYNFEHCHSHHIHLKAQSKQNWHLCQIQRGCWIF